MTSIKTLSMEDIGTRMEHLADLQELWGWALSILTAGTYHSTLEVEQAAELEIGLKLLTQHMSLGYSPTAYAQVINTLPANAEEIVEETKDEIKKRKPRK